MVDGLESRWSAFPQAISEANAVFQLDEARRIEGVNYLRKELDAFLHFVRDELSPGLKTEMDGWVTQMETKIARVGEARKAAHATT
jgi:hypothetical protein